VFGTGEPRPYKLSDRLCSWAKAIRKDINVERIRAGVIALPSPRNRLFASEAMQQADHMILEEFTNAGWLAEKQAFVVHNALGTVDTSPDLIVQPMIYKRLEGANIVGVKKGVENPKKAIVILGHYDTVRNSPGADDNSASVAALLELARVLTDWKFRYSIILAATDMEELWYIGARQLVKALLASYRTIGAINFETMGYTSGEPGTQSVPPGLDLLYGGQIKRLRQRQFRGDFTCIIYNGPAKRLASIMGSSLSLLAGPNSLVLLRDPSDLPIVGKILIRLVPTVRNFARSDHVLFWEERIAAFQVTDTANFRYPHYHKPTDTPEKIDYERVAEIVAATATVIAETAELIQEK
jgi:Zn-dependent M28 family amino/carboxypeptidase